MTAGFGESSLPISPGPPCLCSSESKVSVHTDQITGFFSGLCSGLGDEAEPRLPSGAQVSSRALGSWAGGLWQEVCYLLPSEWMSWLSQRACRSDSTNPACLAAAACVASWSASALVVWSRSCPRETAQLPGPQLLCAHFFCLVL